ncbi:cyclophilin-like fold protein [Acidimangrovimonas pyrenivorans]|uniref:Cyclophilin-like fold protein n=1 Tax=Acidimangrovimonas pyrenivorans TaxID=2030798 RepID=A0ABV7AF38_9RHOB
MRSLLISATAAAALACAPVRAETASGEGKGPAMTRIEVIAGDTVLSATLNDTPTARDFASLLPLELPLSDYHGTEKVADLPRKLDTTGAPASYAPAAGDITLYAPWGNLAIFYQPFRDSAGLVPLGRFDAPLAGRLEDGPVRIRRAD